MAGLITLRYACFVSYYKGQGALIQQFMGDLTEALSSSLGGWLPRDLGVYWDAELNPGNQFQRELARALCQSLCMVVVYTPQYRRSTFCRREFAAMRLIEEQRLERFQRMGIQHAGKGMIIPIILRGADDLPDQLKDHVNCLNFSRYTTADQCILKNRPYIEEIERIARYIYDLYQMFEHSEDVEHTDCDEFMLPSEPLPHVWPATNSERVLGFPH